MGGIFVIIVVGIIVIIVFEEEEYYVITWHIDSNYFVDVLLLLYGICISNIMR